MAFVTLADAKKHLRVDDDASNADITSKLNQAESIVLKYLKAQADPTWTSTTVPPSVNVATLLVLEDLHEHRPIGWDVIERLLVGFRDPALA